MITKRFTLGLISTLILSSTLLAGCKDKVDEAKEQITLNSGFEEVEKENTKQKLNALASVIDTYLKEDMSNSLIDIEFTSDDSKSDIVEYNKIYHFGLNTIFENITKDKSMEIRMKYKKYVDNAYNLNSKYKYNRSFYNDFSNGMYDLYKNQQKTFIKKDSVQTKKDIATLQNRLAKLSKELETKENPSFEFVAEVGYLREVLYAYRNLFETYDKFYGVKGYDIGELKKSKNKDTFNRSASPYDYRIIELRAETYNNTYTNSQIFQLKVFADVNKISAIDKYYTKLDKTRFSKQKSTQSKLNTYHQIAQYNDYLASISSLLTIYGDDIPNSFKEYYISYASNLQIYGQILLRYYSTPHSKDVKINFPEVDENKELTVKNTRIVTKVFNQYYTELENNHKLELQEIKEEKERIAAEAKAKAEAEALEAKKKAEIEAKVAEMSQSKEKAK